MDPETVVPDPDLAYRRRQWQRKKLVVALCCLYVMMLLELRRRRNERLYSSSSDSDSSCSSTNQQHPHRFRPNKRRRLNNVQPAIANSSLISNTTQTQQETPADSTSPEANPQQQHPKHTPSLLARPDARRTTTTPSTEFMKLRRRLVKPRPHSAAAQAHSTTQTPIA